MKYANLILPIAIPQVLTYGIPVDLQGQILIGMRVEVPFGKNKRVSGIVYELHNERPENYQVKGIIKPIDTYPIISKQTLEFWKWISEYYACHLGDVMQAALPAFLKLSTENVLAWIDSDIKVPETLSNDAYALAEYIFNRNEVKVSEIESLKFFGHIGHAIDELLSQQLIEIKESTENSYKPKIVKYIAFCEGILDDNNLEDVFDSLKKTPKQEEVFLKLFQFKNKLHIFSAKELKEKLNISSAQLKSLEAKNIIRYDNITIDRVQLNTERLNTKTVQLSSAQEKVYQETLNLWQQSSHVVLLKGVTGSGKTMVYIQLIKDAIQRGEQALLLLPEIALTQHIISKLEPYFGEELGIYHSKYSNNERVEIWNKVKNNTYKIIVGARSALWLPYQNLKCIIVDEEHDPSYKQKDPAPRFNARDAAIQYAHIIKAKVLLGSATPSFESYHNAFNKKYGYVELNARYADNLDSTFEIVPNNTTVASFSNIISYKILEKIDHTIQSGQQVIIFQNRRGYAPIIYCNDCQAVSKCHHCDVSLTFHKPSNKLQCHYCGQTYHLIQNCTTCGSSKLSIKGYGTQKVEEELNKIFKNYQVTRLDLDTTKGKNGHVEVISNFEKGLSQILVGTQMVVKGLDFENVGLVVILNADTLLYYPDFRVQERAFQLLVQVAGRTGRQSQPGHIMIQSSHTQHPLYTYVVNNDYKQLYKEEMFIRKALTYPPFCRLIQIVVKHIDEEKCKTATDILKNYLDQKSLPVLINGPSPSIVKKIRNKFQYELLIKCPLNSKELSIIKQEILLSVNDTKKTKGNSSIQVIINVDPY